MPIEFINADLEIVSTEDLEPLKVALAAYGDRFFDLYCGETDSGRYLATFEIHPEEEYSEDGNTYRALTAQEKIHAFCDSISELQGLGRDIWFGATSRVIDLGYQSDDQCPTFNDRLSVDTLCRMEKLGIELALTIYPQRKQEAEQAGTSNGGQRSSLNSGFHPRRG